jgi:non-heme chloroperoxidase
MLRLNRLEEQAGAFFSAQTEDEAMNDGALDLTSFSRRDALLGGLMATIAIGLPAAARAQTAATYLSSNEGRKTMSTIITKDGAEIYYKDWGSKSAQPIVFHHGWPLSGDDWDTQMLYFLNKGYRVIAHDRRGHGRSAQISDGHDMDHYAADVAAMVEHLNLRNAVHIGHSTGGGEATRHVARHGQGRVAKLVLIGAVPPIMVKTPANPGGLPIEVFDGLRKALADNRAQFYIDFPTGPFYSFNRAGAKMVQGLIQNWWRQAMMGGAKAHYDSIKAFSETDFTEDLKSIAVPTLVMHGDDDQIVPIADSALLSVELLRKGTLKVYKGLPHGLCATHADVVNPDLHAFIAG